MVLKPWSTYDITYHESNKTIFVKSMIWDGILIWSLNHQNYLWQAKLANVWPEVNNSKEYKKPSHKPQCKGTYGICLMI